MHTLFESAASASFLDLVDLEEFPSSLLGAEQAIINF
jgi:hypothetical protein